MSIPKNIIFCDKNYCLDIFDKEEPYKCNKKIHYVSNGHLFNPPFFEIVIFARQNEEEENLKLLWNMTLLNGFLIIPEKLFSFFENNKEIKKYKNFIMIKKINNIVYNPILKYRVVDFIIVGTQKGGTTAAMLNLSKHDDIYLHPEEIHYFDIFINNGLSWYKKHFDYTKKMVGEKTPDLMYLTQTHSIIQGLNPYVKLIFFLRNPIYRAYSSWNMLRTKWGEKKSFKECIDEELNFRINENRTLYTSSYHFLQRGLYYEQITNMLKWFPIQNMCFLISEQVKINMNESYNKIYTFLNLEKKNNIEYTEEFISSYSEEIDSEMIEKLKSFFIEDVKKLEKLINIKTHWFD
jgi:hypothetical protein